MSKHFQITEQSQTIAAWLSIPMVVVAAILIFQGSSILWLMPSVMMYAAIYLANTAGAHRLFSHRSYECSVFWQRVLSVLCTLSMQGSAVSWVHVHCAHHAFADTNKDPHINGWKYLWWRQYRTVEKPSKLVARLLQDPWHRWLHHYALVPVIVLSAVLFAVNPYLLIFGYLAPLGYFFVVTGIHMAICHQRGMPVNMPLLELVLPMGEWRHKEHHDHPGKWDYGRWDFGSWFIGRIKL